MRIELVNTGTELLLGRVLNSHQQWICGKLTALGYTVDRQTTVPDTGPAIQEAVREALTRADLVITTGGLGPTSDDQTRDHIAQLLELRLSVNESVKADIEQFFAARKRTAPAHTEVQAMVPEGALVLRNDCGTAPGLAIKVPAGRFRAAGSWLVMLPGPPNELHPMFNEQVIPLLCRELPLQEKCVCKTLRTTGIGESLAAGAVESSLQALVNQGLEVGYCARPGEVDIRLVAHGFKGEQIVKQAEQIVRQAMGEYLFGVNEDDLPAIVVSLLRAKGKTLAVAESCTGGNLAHRLTNVPGASDVFLGGVVSYHNKLKENLLGVRATTLDQHGAVSEQTACEMAIGARERSGADYAISTTGIAGPSGGTHSKPVGTVFIGFSSARGTEVLHRLNPQGREIFKYVTTQQALEVLRRELR